MKRIFKASNGAKFTREQGFTLIRDHAGIVAAVDSRDVEEYAADITDALAKDATISELQKRAATAERELTTIDGVLARRPALDDLPTREAKILKAISTARRVTEFESLARQIQDAVIEFEHSEELSPLTPAIEERLRQLLDAAEAR